MPATNPSDEGRPKPVSATDLGPAIRQEQLLMSQPSLTYPLPSCIGRPVETPALASGAVFKEHGA